MSESENMVEAGVKRVMNTVVQNSSTPMMVMVILFVLLFWVLYYIYSIVKKKEYNCKMISLQSVANVVDIPEDVLITPLNKTTVKTAYNCCCSGDFKNDYVDTCALMNCAKQGVRALDFTIYSLHGEPVISAATLVSKKYKEMYNSLPFSKTMTQVKQIFMYDSANCRNIRDPLFLILRIQSANLKLYNKIGDILQSVFGRSNSSGDKIYKSKSIETELISNLMEKVIIFVDITGLTGYESSSLSSVTALVFGTMTSQIYRETEAYDLLDSNIHPNDPDINILYPDFGNKSTNYDFNTVGLKQQFQFIGMNFQGHDIYLDAYNKIFKSSIIKSIPRIE
jgi:hypothetical protein